MYLRHLSDNASALRVLRTTAAHWGLLELACGARPLAWQRAVRA